MSEVTCRNNKEFCLWEYSDTVSLFLLTAILGCTVCDSAQCCRNCPVVECDTWDVMCFFFDDSCDQLAVNTV